MVRHYAREVQVRHTIGAHEAPADHTIGEVEAPAGHAIGAQVFIGAPLHMGEGVGCARREAVDARMAGAALPLS